MGLLQAFKQSGVIYALLDAVAIATGGVAALALVDAPDAFPTWVGISCVVRMFFYPIFGVHRIIWKYLTFKDSVYLCFVIAITGIPSGLIFYYSHADLFKWRIIVIDFLCTSLFCLSARALVRIRNREWKNTSAGKRRTIIYGAGRLGQNLSNWLQSQKESTSVLIGFIDDNPALLGSKISGTPIIATSENFEHTLKKHSIQEVIVSTNRIYGTQLQKIMEVTYSHRIPIRIYSDIDQISFEKKEKPSILRQLKMEDLLVRNRLSIDTSGIANILKGRVVLVTGAGGTIGSELCRQIMNGAPKKILILDSSEFALFLINDKIKSLSGNAVEIVPILMSLAENSLLPTVLKNHKVQVVFHAAAYKHVSLCEQNICSAIQNNILGTKVLLESIDYSCLERFVLVSSDKAVNPKGVMGATKRLCERMVFEKAREKGGVFTVVRFGNILGSSGSLIPKIRNQIRSGGPVILTDPRMTRYFMLKEEAVSLVLRAAVKAEKCEIYVLRMGDPIKILDIVKNLMQLLGKTESEIPIITTGAQLGEKLHEELLSDARETATEHKDIFIIRPHNLKKEGISWNEIAHLLKLANQNSPDAPKTLFNLLQRDEKIPVFPNDSKVA